MRDGAELDGPVLAGRALDVPQAAVYDVIHGQQRTLT
jgi:hypothetical protein